MCLAIPCKIVEIDNGMGVVDVSGVKAKVSLMLIENPKVGEYIIVHAGFAIQKIDEIEAMGSLRVLREIASIHHDKDNARQSTGTKPAHEELCIKFCLDSDQTENDGHDSNNCQAEQCISDDFPMDVFKPFGDDHCAKRKPSQQRENVACSLRPIQHLFFVVFC